MSLDVMKGPTASASWLLWCNALHLIKAPEAERAEYFAKHPQQERELLTRMQTIHTKRCIPLEEFF